jgi:hypothetical protein
MLLINNYIKINYNIIDKIIKFSFSTYFFIFYFDEQLLISFYKIMNTVISFL